MPDQSIRHETRDIALRPVLGTAAGVALLVVAAGIALSLALPATPPAYPNPRRGEAPLLQVAPPADLAALVAEQRAARDGLDWADRDKGLARIPVEEAMRIVARRGLTRRGVPDGCSDRALSVPRAPQTECGGDGE